MLEDDPVQLVWGYAVTVIQQPTNIRCRNFGVESAQRNLNSISTVDVGFPCVHSVVFTRHSLTGEKSCEIMMTPAMISDFTWVVSIWAADQRLAAAVGLSFTWKVELHMQMTQFTITAEIIIVCLTWAFELQFPDVCYHASHCQLGSFQSPQSLSETCWMIHALNWR